MTKKTAGQIQEISGQIEKVAGVKVRQLVMKDSEKAAASSNPKDVALWVKDAMDRLDSNIDAAKRKEIMLACGHNCCALNKRPMEMARTRRRKFPTEDAFLSAEVHKPPKGVRLERHGDVLIHYYTPRTYGNGMRCYCSLMHGLPEGVTASSTYCLCSRGFMEKYWEGILGRPVKVELGDTAISGATECKFTVYL